MNILKSKLISTVLKYAGKKMDGKKTYAGGIGLILTGVIGLLGIAFPDMGLLSMDIDTAIGYITGGLGVMGVGHKIEKQSHAEPK